MVLASEMVAVPGEQMPPASAVATVMSTANKNLNVRSFNFFPPELDRMCVPDMVGDLSIYQKRYFKEASEC